MNHILAYFTSALGVWRICSDMPSSRCVKIDRRLDCFCSICFQDEHGILNGLQHSSLCPDSFQKYKSLQYQFISEQMYIIHSRFMIFNTPIYNAVVCRLIYNKSKISKEDICKIKTSFYIDFNLISSDWLTTFYSAPIWSIPRYSWLPLPCSRWCVLVVWSLVIVSVDGMFKI